MGDRCFIVVVCGVWLALLATPAAGRPLRDAIPGLFGGQLCATVQQGVCEPRRLRGLRRFRSLPALLQNGFPAPPLPSASGAFRFAWDPRFDTYARRTRSLGPIFAERAETLGRGKSILSFAYSRVDFDTFEGARLGRLRFSDQALSADFVARLPPGDRARVADDVIETRLNLSISSDVFFVAAAYGLTDEIDVSLGLTFGQTVLRGSAESQVRDANGAGDAFFQAGGGRFCVRGGKKDPRCVSDSFDDSAFGTGDVFLRGKWNFTRWRVADLSVAGTLTLPTGNADDFLGFHDPTFTPWLIASRTFGRVSPHLNLGYAFRSGADVSQAQWVAGADVRAAEWLTVAADFLGFHDDTRDGSNDDVLQAALGIKVNPVGHSVLAAGVQLPLNRDGLRADVIYTLQVEQTF